PLFLFRRVDIRPKPAGIIRPILKGQCKLATCFFPQLCITPQARSGPHFGIFARMHSTEPGEDWHEKPEGMAKEKEANLFEYTEDSIKSLDWKEHIRLRPGMYIGKLGDGSSPDDGIYVLVKEVMDNCIDEYTMGYGKTIELSVEGKTVTVRDYGRGI